MRTIRYLMPRSQRLEVEVLSGAQNNRLAVNDRAIERQRRNGIPDAQDSLRIVGRGAGPQAHLLAILAGDDPVSVELDLVQPARTGRRPNGKRGLAGQDEAGGLQTGPVERRRARA
jgi:hypothetical protein